MTAKVAAGRGVGERLQSLSKRTKQRPRGFGLFPKSEICHANLCLAVKQKSTTFFLHPLAGPLALYTLSHQKMSAHALSLSLILAATAVVGQVIPLTQRIYPYAQIVRKSHSLLLSPVLTLCYSLTKSILIPVAVVHSQAIIFATARPKAPTLNARLPLSTALMVCPFSFYSHVKECK